MRRSADPHASARRRCVQRATRSAGGVAQPISRATTSPSSRIASGSVSRIAAGALPACTSSSSTADAEDEPIVPGSAQHPAGDACAALGMAGVDDVAACSDRRRPRS